MNSKSINRNVWTLTLSLCLGVIFTHATGYAAEERKAVVAGEDIKLLGQAITSSIVTRKGAEFPLVAGASCEPHDTQTFTQNAAIDLESPVRVKKTNTYPDPPPMRKVVSPPNADWVIQSYHRVITSVGPPYEAGDSAFPAGYSFLTAGNYSSVKSTMHSFVAGLNVSGQIKADLNAKLDTLISNISSYSYYG